MTKQDRQKQEVALYAVECIESGMIVGLGTGSTVHFALLEIADRIKTGKLRDIRGIPSSLATEKKARDLGIPLTTLDDNATIDVTIDGADEVDPHLNLIKGGGGALLREKVIAQSSYKNIIIVDESKMVSTLGSNCPLPVEVLPFARQPVANYLKNLGAEVVIRTKNDNSEYLTDQNNIILDCHFGPIENPNRLAVQLKSGAGVIEHGLFLGLASKVFAAGKNGIIEYTSA